MVCLEYFAGGLGGDKALQEPFLLAHLTAALAAGEGEIHVVALDGVGPIGVALWYVCKWRSQYTQCPLTFAHARALLGLAQGTSSLIREHHHADAQDVLGTLC